MKTKYILTYLAIVIFSNSAEAQILKKLKNKAERAAERVLLKKSEEKTEEIVENAFDSIANKPKSGKNQKKSANLNNGDLMGSSKNSSVNHNTINTAAKRNFYTADVVIKTSENGEKGSYSYFDADAIAMRGEAPDGTLIYIDSEGYNYGFSDSAKRWEKTGLMKTDAMAFMMPMNSLSILKLPTGPTLEASEKLKAAGLNLNTFQMVEWVFIYKPEHFRNPDYVESTNKCNSGECLRFHYTDPAYKGSYAEFDAQGRLSKIYIETDTPEGRKKGTFEFNYQPVVVTVPDAVEVKMPFQDLLFGGLDATNKKNDRSTTDSTSTSSILANNFTNQKKNIQSGKNEEQNISNQPIQSDVNDFTETFEMSKNDITTVLRVKGQMIVLKLDVDKQLMKMDLKEKRMEPLIFDGNNHIYMVQGSNCIKAKFDMNELFDQAVEGLSGETLPPKYNIEKSREKYYETQMGMDLTIKKFPIVEWAYIIKEEAFKNSPDFESKTISCNNIGTCIMYTKKGDSDKNYILFGTDGRLAEIQSTEGGTGTISYTYHLKHNISTPTGECQEINMNKDVFAKLFGN